jgi:hypothetical protein
LCGNLAKAFKALLKTCLPYSCFTTKKLKRLPLLPIDTRHGTGINGLLNQLFGAPFKTDHFGLLTILSHLENFRTYFGAGLTTYTFFFVNINSFLHEGPVPLFQIKKARNILADVIFIFN